MLSLKGVGMMKSQKPNISERLIILKSKQTIVQIPRGLERNGQHQIVHLSPRESTKVAIEFKENT